MKYVIIGAGIAGVTAAKNIKQIESGADVVVIGEESHFPYNRFLLTEYLSGAIHEDALFYLPPDFFRMKNIQFRKGQRVKSISTTEKTVKLAHNEVMPYDRLLIATGGSPALGPVLRRFERHIQRYYSLTDILVLKDKLKSIAHCVVSGSGLSTLDLLCGLCNLGKRITYITRSEKAKFPVIKSQFDGTLHEFLQNKGIEILSKDQIVEIEKAGGRYRVATLNQNEIVTDIVFGSDYYQPELSCIADTPIEKKLGILVDQHLKTSVSDIYAAGDCVEIYHPVLKNYWINFGWPNAIAQGEIAGKNMAGEDKVYSIRETLVFNLMGKALKARWWE
ncbi:FAD-dependent oxidoreductase [candidate division KSB1 bacterium]|nr:FAD-dependent oxidoreductase [candidate division KSB1 bacterium]